MNCPHCGRAIEAGGASFCPFCGGALNAAHAENEEARALIDRALRQSDPVQKHALLEQAQQTDPQSLRAAEELLLLGRLHERDPRHIELSVIKCHLLMLYLEPETFSPAQADAARQELFSHPQLERCLSLAPDKEAFLRRYLERLCGEFIQLFLRGSSRYMHRVFGLGSESRAPKYLASPVAVMLSRVWQDEALSPDQRLLLRESLYRAFAADMRGDTEFLDARMKEIGLPPMNA